MLVVSCLVWFDFIGGERERERFVCTHYLSHCDHIEQKRNSEKAFECIFVNARSTCCTRSEKHGRTFSRWSETAFSTPVTGRDKPK